MSVGSLLDSDNFWKVSGGFRLFQVAPVVARFSKYRKILIKSVSEQGRTQKIVRVEEDWENNVTIVMLKIMGPKGVNYTKYLLNCTSVYCYYEF